MILFEPTFTCSERARSGSFDVAWLIVENGGERSVRLRNQDGLTPLELARKGGNGELVEVLEGADKEMEAYLAKRSKATTEMMSPD